MAEINERMGRLNPTTPKLNALPLYAGLPTSEQLAVFQPAQEGERKVIVATNVAEASVTIDGIVYVVDCGFVKVRSSLNSLKVVACIQPKIRNRIALSSPNITSISPSKNRSRWENQTRKMLSVVHKGCVLFSWPNFCSRNPKNRSCASNTFS